MKFEDVKRGYASMWRAAKIRPEKLALARRLAMSIAADRGRYDPVSRTTGVPWWWIAIVHQLESGRKFDTHLHNGDPLTARTVHVPAGRPVSGEPPFTWQASAVDALLLKGLEKVPEWTVERALWEWERYNGLGYFTRKINSPYLWSYTHHYTKGKYVADGKFDPDAVSQQCGAAAMLLALIEIGQVQFKTEADPMREVVEALGAFQKMAPALAAAAAGPMGLLAVRAIAEALGEPAATPEQVKEKLEATPISDLLTALRKAEAIVAQIIPLEPAVTVAPTPAPIVIETPAPTPPAPEPGPLDNLFGGSFLMGWKTFLGAGLFVLVQVLDALQIAPGILTPPVIEAVGWLAGLLAGTGLIAKLERWVIWLRPKVATVVTVK